MGNIIYKGRSYGGSFVFDGAGSHNAIYRGAYLGSQVTEEQYQAIADGTFRDLFIGDYWTINGVNYRIACFDYYYYSDDPHCTTHHVTLVPDTPLYEHCMNSSSDTTSGYYVNSDMYKTGLTQAKEIINNTFGVEHVLNLKKYLKNASGYDWYDCTVGLMSERNVYGNLLEASKDSNNFTLDVSQFPLFAFNRMMIHNGYKYWLMDVVNTISFACTDIYGTSNANGSRNVCGVRPSFNIKG